MPDASNDANDIVHEFISIHGFNLEFAFALAALFVVAFLAAETEIVATGDDCDWFFEFVTVGALDLWEHGFINIL